MIRPEAHFASPLRLLPLFFLLGCATSAAASPGPQPARLAPAIPAPRDEAYPGTLKLLVDVTDLDRRIFKVHEELQVEPGAGLILRYPKWLPGTHSPEGPLDRLAGLTVSAGETRVDWQRDPLDVYSFHLAVPKGVSTLSVDFQYLSPVDHAVGRAEVGPELLVLDWNEVVLYPAGYFTRDIPVAASLRVPAGWKVACALEPAAQSSAEGQVTRFKEAPLETVIDSPVRTGRYFKQYDLSLGDGVKVSLDLFADRPDLLEVNPRLIGLEKELVRQANKLFGSHHYDHYDFLLTLSEFVGWDTTLEHHRSAEYGEQLTEFSEWEKTGAYRDVIAHEFVHSWDGKFRRPADLWTPDYSEPMRNSLLWVYEGGTTYWGEVLTARAGLWSKEQALESLAISVAELEGQPGRAWRPLQDTTNDEIINPRKPQSWPDWQRFEDYYAEGALIWLDADTLIRERSQGKKSLDDFARAFFGIENGSYRPVTYLFDDVVKALNEVLPNDWAAFLRARLDRHGGGAPLEGLTRGGYKLVFTEEPGEQWKSAELRRKKVDHTWSIGLSLDKDARLGSVAWDGPAFKAGLTVGMTLLAVDGLAYDAERLKQAIQLAKGGRAPIELLVREGDRFRTMKIDYHGGLRFPHLERDPAHAALLDEILAPAK